jgi:hypothetical protein
VVRLARLADHPQREADPGVAVVGALEHAPGRQLTEQAVRRGDWETGDPGDLGQRMGAAAVEGQEDRRDPARHRTSALR